MIFDLNSIKNSDYVFCFYCIIKSYLSLNSLRSTGFFLICIANRSYCSLIQPQSNLVKRRFAYGDFPMIGKLGRKPFHKANGNLGLSIEGNDFINKINLQNFASSLPNMIRNSDGMCCTMITGQVNDGLQSNTPCWGFWRLCTLLDDAEK